MASKTITECDAQGFCRQTNWTTNATGPSAEGDSGISQFKIKKFLVSATDGVTIGGMSVDQAITELASAQNIKYGAAVLIVLSILVFGYCRQWVLMGLGVTAGAAIYSLTIYPWVGLIALLGCLTIAGGWLIYCLRDRWKKNTTTTQLVTGVQAVRNQLRQGQPITNVDEFDKLIGQATTPIAERVISAIKTKQKTAANSKARKVNEVWTSK